MNYLLDTHILIWTFFEPAKLSKRIQQILTDGNNDIFVSAVSFWEISIKTGTGKISLGDINPSKLPEICRKYGFKLIDITVEEGSSFHKLSANYHKDPFDRMLIWQAISGDYNLITDDSLIHNYISEGLRVSW
ncbi:type II toxin-antitoxin system VapC family toxin [Dyadobacter sp. CY343]|uniref:type II toxin-antitoxin system VapC family toxin n=1 Tax=Dyadobacter sp. CY343 TaxID=2907299 RepID=UPI001F38695B|nr:type II toxin-antitoxin system VapC family toxin [Dyadobacter sp. CY343]MCE7062035.1 type II toxin-antitoxin system VapC family toxin [Dyadobacter sp. CY343]